MLLVNQRNKRWNGRLGRGGALRPFKNILTACVSSARGENPAQAARLIQYASKRALHQNEHEKSTLNGCVAFFFLALRPLRSRSSLNKIVVIRHARVQSRQKMFTWTTAESCVLAMNGKWQKRDGEYLCAVSFAWFHFFPSSQRKMFSLSRLKNFPRLSCPCPRNEHGNLISQSPTSRWNSSLRRLKHNLWTKAERVFFIKRHSQASAMRSAQEHQSLRDSARAAN